MKKAILLTLIAMMIVSSCKTVDVEKTEVDRLREANEQLTKENGELSENNQLLTLKVEKAEEDIRKLENGIAVEPLYVPVKEVFVIPETAAVESNEEMTTEEAVQNSYEESLVTLKNYTGGTSIYDYDETRQFPVFTRILNMTVIIFEEGEKILTDPYMSDTVRWDIVGDTWIKDGKEVPLLMIKPMEAGLETNMLIITDRHLYHFVLYSGYDNYQPMITFRYPKNMQYTIGSSRYGNMSENEVVTGIPDYDMEEKDVKYFSYNYKIKKPFFQMFKKITWWPEMVYDDGEFMYIVFPQSVLHAEMPVVHENKDEIVNYDVQHNIMKIYKLCTELTLTLDGKDLIIKKKKG